MSEEPPQFVLPQFGIFAQGTHAHRFLEFDLKSGVDAAQAVAAFRRLRTPDVSAGGVNLVAGFGAELWRSVAPSRAPADLGPFQTINGRDGHTAPAVQHDAWLWLSGAELFAIASAAVYADTIAREHPERRQAAYELADLFAGQARRRVDVLFAALWHNDDDDGYAAAEKLLDGRYTWLEEGVL